MSFIFVIAYLQKRAGVCTGMAPQTELKSHSCPQGQGTEGEKCPCPSPKLRREVTLQAPPCASSQAHSSALEQTLTSQEMKEELPWSSLSDRVFHSKSNRGSRQGAALGDTQGICICFADYRSCTFYFKHQWVATAIQMIWKLLLHTEMSLKQQSKRLAQSFGFYLFTYFLFNKTPWWQWKTLWWLWNSTCTFEYLIHTKLQNIWSLLCNCYDNDFQLKYHSLSDTPN